MVVHLGEITVVGYPMERDRILGGGEFTGEAYVQVIFRFEKLVCLRVEVGHFIFNKEYVRERIFARETRHTGGEENPLREFNDIVALELDEAIHDLRDMFGAARVHPDDGVIKMFTVFIDRNGARPLRGYRNGCDALERDNILRNDFF